MFNKKEKQLLYSNKLSLEMKNKLIKSCIWSVALYGSEIWTLGKNEERIINTFETWCWRGMLKIKWTDSTKFTNSIKVKSAVTCRYNDKTKSRNHRTVRAAGRLQFIKFLLITNIAQRMLSVCSGFMDRHQCVCGYMSLRMDPRKK